MCLINFSVLLWTHSRRYLCTFVFDLKLWFSSIWNDSWIWFKMKITIIILKNLLIIICLLFYDRTILIIFLSPCTTSAFITINLFVAYPILSWTNNLTWCFDNFLFWFVMTLLRPVATHSNSTNLSILIWLSKAANIWSNML